jgi:hypothetical protein
MMKRPLTHEHFFVSSHIRAGRAAADKTRMIKLTVEVVGWRLKLIS